MCKNIYLVAPTGGAVLLEVDVGHVAGPVPVLHSGELGAVVGVASVLGREPCGYNTIAVEEGAWAFRLSASAWRNICETHPSWVLQVQRAALLQEMYNGARIRTMSRLWLAGGWSGANFDTITALSDYSESREEEHNESSLPPSLQHEISQRFKQLIRKLYGEEREGGRHEGDGGAHSQSEMLVTPQARWARAASRWVSRRRSVNELC